VSILLLKQDTSVHGDNDNDRGIVLQHAIATFITRCRPSRPIWHATLQAALKTATPHSDEL